MEIQKNKYIIITPVKNELNFFKETLKSVCNQSILPIKWIIIDDASTDGTSELINSYAGKFNFIDHHRLDNFKPGLNTTGGRSGALMNYARKLIPGSVDIVVKIDADISFDETFFESLFKFLNQNPKLGIVSGHLVQDGKPEKITDYSSNRGAVRVYRKECFEQIGFFYTSRGEDQMDTYKAKFLGWETRTFDVYFNHLKPEGGRNNFVKNNFETGQYKGRIPYNFLFFCLTLIKNISKKPYVISSSIQLYGYIYSRWIRRQRPFEKRVCVFIRKNQKKRIEKYLLKVMKILKEKGVKIIKLHYSR